MKNTPAKKIREVLLALLLILFWSLSQAQEAKLRYRPELDSLWSRSTYISKLSPDGNWLVLIEVFDHKESILHLRSTADTTAFRFESPSHFTFSKNSQWFGCISPGGLLQLVNLKTLVQKNFSGASSYSFSKSGNFIAVVRKKDISQPELEIADLAGNQTEILQKVGAYSWHPERPMLSAVITKDNKASLLLYDAAALRSKLLMERDAGRFAHLQWSGSGNALTFAEQSEMGNRLYSYQLEGPVRSLDRMPPEADGSVSLSDISGRMHYISEDGNRILFYRELRELDASVPSSMEVWNADAPLLFPKMEQHLKNEARFLLTAWYPESGRTVAIATAENPNAAADASHQHALVFSKLQYEPLYKEFFNADLYSKNMETGEKHLVATKQFAGPGFVSISPGGRYVAYFRNRQWWVYDSSDGTSLRLGQNFGQRFENAESDYAGDIPPYGSPGWLLGESHFILYDRHDIWLASPDGKSLKRVTKGKEEKRRYRISVDSGRDSHRFFSTGGNFSSQSHDLQKGIVLDLSEEQSHRTGYALWKDSSGIVEIIFQDRKIDAALLSGNTLVFRSQKFNEPPSIWEKQTDSEKEPHLLFQSNRSLMDYDLGAGKLIKYRAVDGKELIGSLIYPSGFDWTKKYPMIVCIYDKASGRINNFNPPSDFEPDGFNTLKYIANGYFVLFPDISYGIGKPGFSSLQCVENATTAALATGFIDSSRLGLVGHSFGGYQTSFIVTKSKRFAAAVAGAPVTDFTSHYHSVGWNYNEPEIWRYENQQFRMGKSYYADRNAYLQNSPLYHAQNIETPLLLWTGKQDNQVHWTQSVEMFLALRRQGKKGKLLMFEKEPHSLLQKGSQGQLSLEIMEWFDAYCK